MNPVSIILFMMFVLPALLLKEVYRGIVRFISKNRLGMTVLYLLIFALIALFIVLYIKGYR